MLVGSKKALEDDGLDEENKRARAVLQACQAKKVGPRQPAASLQAITAKS